MLAYSLPFFFFQAEDGIRDDLVTGVQTCALPISTCLTAARHVSHRGPVPALAAPARRHERPADPRGVVTAVEEPTRTSESPGHADAPADAVRLHGLADGIAEIVGHVAAAPGRGHEDLPGPPR